MSLPDEAALRCEGLSKSFGAEPVVSDLNLTVQAGHVQALVGLNGAGKTTLMRMVLGMTRPDSGWVRVLGFDVARAPRACWAGVGQMIETPFAYPELTVRENLHAAARLHGLTRSGAPAAVAEMIDRLGLAPWADRRSSTLSQGNRQRLGLAAALVHSPKLLVLDEPTNALDPAGVVLLRDLVEEIADGGAAVLVSSHHLDEVARVADRVSILHHGSVIGELDPDGVDLERAFFAMVCDADRVAGADGGPTERPYRRRFARRSAAPGGH